MRFVPLLLLLVVACGGPGSDRGDPAPDGGDDVAHPAGSSDRLADSVLVRFRTSNGPSLQRRASSIARFGGTMQDRDGDGIYDPFANLAGGELALIELPKGTSVDDAIAALRADPTIQYAEPNYVVHAIATPDDPSFAQLYGLHNTGQTGGTDDADIDAVEAWNTTIGSNEIVVGVIDTGVAYNHPDLAANMWVNPNEVPGNGVDDDGNGVIDDIHGYNAITGSGNPMDDHYHGTHCAGTIGATGNNTAGVVGVNWETSIMAIKFLSSGGSGTTAGAIASVNYAVGQRNAGVNLRVLSNSWGGGGFSQALSDAISAANDAGILFVAAAGNSAVNNDTSPHYPSSYDLPNVVAVAATDHNDGLAGFSCWGPTSVDLGAPGVNILSTKLNGTYGTASGTSMATPHVSGVAALVLAHNDTLSVAELKDVLLTSGDPVPSLAGKTVSGRRLNAAAALEQAGPAVPHFKLSASPPGQAVNQEQTASFALDVTSVAGFTGDVQLTVAAEPALNGTLTITPSTVTSPGTATLTVATSQATAPGIYSLTITGTSGTLVKTRTVSLRVRRFGTADHPFPSADTPKPITNPGTITSVIHIPPSQGIRIEEVSVQLDITHPYIGDLAVTLTSPEGTVATLHNRTGGSADNIHQSYALPIEFMSEQAAGDWVLTVVDHKSFDGGTLDNWVLHVLGVPEPAETTPPVAAITAPASGATVANTVTITASASDDTAVRRVDFYLDGAVIGTDATQPYSFAWSSRTAANGPHTLHVVAYDPVGNAGQSTPISVTTDNDFTAPTVAISSPAEGATVAGTVSIVADASDNVGVTRVDFFVDGAVKASDTSAPFSYDWSSLTVVDGNHALSARAYDAVNNSTASAVVTVVVDNDHAPPSVAITAPADGATVAGAVTITATASDDVGVTRVEFLVDGVLKMTDSSAPFSYSWPSTTVTNGSHALVARAHDAVGNTTTSATVTVTTDNDQTPPTVAITSPASGATVAGTTTIAAEASDNVGVTRVELYVDGVLKGSDTTAPYSLAWDTAMSGNGSHTLTAKAYDALANVGTSAAVTVTANNPGLATYDPVRKAPVCAATGAACDTGGLVNGRNGKGPELNAPNTINASCIDGTSGSYHSDESLDRLRIFTSDGSTLAAGKLVTIEATVWNYGSNTLDLYFTTTPDAPSWTLITSLPGGSGGGVKTLTTTFTLPPAPMVAIRGNFRYGGSQGSCTSGGYNDRDDLVFAVEVEPDTTPPTTAITAPASGATLTGTVTVTASASDNQGVTAVELYVDGTRIATAATAPYSFSWDTSLYAEGSHTLATRAIDAAGNAGDSAPVTVTVDNADHTPPTTAITAPSSGATVSGNVSISATASDNEGVTSVQLLVDGVQVASDATAPYGFVWNSKTVPNGSHVLATRALDAAGNSGTSAAVSVNVDNDYEAPVTAITSPSGGAIVGGTVTITASATDNKAVSLVEIYVDGVKLGSDASAPYSAVWNTSSVANGTHTLTSRAIDAAGNVGDSASISVTVQNDVTPPSVAITSPAAGALLRGSVTVTADASDNVGVSAVELYVDGVKVATDTTSPFGLVWATTGTGGRILRARAIDSAGNTSDSAAVTVTVDNQPPVTLVTSPAQGAIVGGTVTVSASAGDIYGVSRVEILVNGFKIGEGTSFPYTATWNTSQFANGTHALTSRATDTAGNVATSAARTVTVANGEVAASYDPSLRAPMCSSYGSGCTTGNLVNGRGASESNASNTINGSCGDGYSGAYHADESIDRLRIFTTDGGPLAAGKSVTVEATIWARSNLTDSDALDLYVTTTPSNPSWSLLATLLPGNVNGQRVLTASFTLPAAGTQAIRGNLRRRLLGGGSASPCTAGNYNDHDDLIFTVAP